MAKSIGPASGQHDLLAEIRLDHLRVLRDLERRGAWWVGRAPAPPSSRPGPRPCAGVGGGGGGGGGPRPFLWGGGRGGGGGGMGGAGSSPGGRSGGGGPPPISWSRKRIEPADGS